MAKLRKHVDAEMWATTRPREPRYEGSISAPRGSFDAVRNLSPDDKVANLVNVGLGLAGGVTGAALLAKRGDIYRNTVPLPARLVAHSFTGGGRPFTEADITRREAVTLRRIAQRSLARGYTPEAPPAGTAAPTNVRDRLQAEHDIVVPRTAAYAQPIITYADKVKFRVPDTYIAQTLGNAFWESPMTVRMVTHNGFATPPAGAENHHKVAAIAIPQVVVKPKAAPTKVTDEWRVYPVALKTAATVRPILKTKLQQIFRPKDFQSSATHMTPQQIRKFAIADLRNDVRGDIARNLDPWQVGSRAEQIIAEFAYKYGVPFPVALDLAARAKKTYK